MLLSRLTNSASQEVSDSPWDSETCFLQYSMTRARMLLGMIGNGITISPAQLYSWIIRLFFIFQDSMATFSSNSNVSPSELLSFIIFFTFFTFFSTSMLVDAIVVFKETNTERERERERERELQVERVCHCVWKW